MPRSSKKKKTSAPDSPQAALSIPTTGIAVSASDAIARVGGIVAQYRARLGQVQKQLAESVIDSNRTEIAALEEGRRLPTPDKLRDICEALNVPKEFWYPATHPHYLIAMTFQQHLSELLGKPVSLDRLGPDAGYMAVDRIGQLLKGQHSSTQAYDAFKCVLTFYGEKSPTSSFFDRFLGSEAFRSVETFRDKVRAFLAIGLRLYGNFRRAWKTLSVLHDLSRELRPLEPVDQAEFTTRRPFTAIRTISPDRLDDLGYISVERARKEFRERTEICNHLSSLASGLRKNGVQALEKLPEFRRRRISKLLVQFESKLDPNVSLFEELTPDRVDQEIKRLKPSQNDLSYIETTQRQGLQNLCAYLSEPFIDVYVATSMREHADFVAVNSFVEAVFSHADIQLLHLRYFNPTQSWIDDRVAKGLVEALMLRRSKLTIYMAQRTDTFGKDSEASVALGQGKAVVVYVPRLYDEQCDINSSIVYSMKEAELRDKLRELTGSEEEGLDHKELVTEVLTAMLRQLSPGDIARIVRNHWADFDLPGEAKQIKDETLATSWVKYCKTLESASTATGAALDATLASAFVSRLAKIAVDFERRAYLFRETHPLALQVIIESGVLNGMLVVRSVDQCATLMFRLLTNTVEMTIREDSNNYSLIESVSGSTVRVVSKFPLLTNAFWTQYFEE